MKQFANYLLGLTGYELVRRSTELPPDVDIRDRTIIERVRAYTLTSTERLIASISAARHVSRVGINGSIVECGVWRGGSAMAMALALVDEGDVKRDFFLYDTYEGMSSPTAHDRDLKNVAAVDHLAADPGKTGVWCVADLDDVRKNVLSTGYPSNRIHLIRGKVEDTIPDTIPSQAAIIRLDTDWYESTKHELVHLFPLLAARGILMIDDYGHWQGARKAVDEFLERSNTRSFLHRIDYTGRLLVKES